MTKRYRKKITVALSLVLPVIVLFAILKMNDEFDNLMVQFESEYSIEKIVDVVKKIPVELREKSINQYQIIIRKNKWYYPSLCDVADLHQFMERWSEVHKEYFSFARQVFEEFSKNNCSLDCLTTKEILDEAIRSETMRGWVGKRSPSGLDALLRQREEIFTSSNINLSMDEVDNILDYWGLYHDSEHLSAEHELIQLMTSEDYQEKRNEVLRNFCQYNLDNLLEKEESIKECRNVVSEDNFAEEQPIQGSEILEEIRALNYLNLSLEVKYSFKGFAGLMHMLVFYACKLKTGTENVYEMLNKLN